MPKAAPEFDLSGRAPGRDLCGHIVTGRPPSECPSCRGGLPPVGEVHRIEGTDDELAARAAAVGWPVDAYVRGVRLAEENARRLAEEGR